MRKLDVNLPRQPVKHRGFSSTWGAKRGNEGSGTLDNYTEAPPNRPVGFQNRKMPKNHLSLAAESPSSEHTASRKEETLQAKWTLQHLMAVLSVNFTLSIFPFRAINNINYVRSLILNQSACPEKRRSEPSREQSRRKKKLSGVGCLFVFPSTETLLTLDDAAPT